MKNFNQFEEYLKDDKFTDQLIIDISEDYDERGRWAAIKELIEGKKVIHVGCLDHVPLIPQRIKDGEWVHGLVTDIASKCIGIDINKEGVEYVRNEIGYDNVIHADLAKDIVPELINESWDVILLGEIVEHLDNPVEFLSSIQEKYSGTVAEIIITVPHAFSLHNFQNAKNRKEVINSDHRFWFTPFTIAKLMAMSGIETTEIQFVNCSALSFSDKLKYKFNKMIGKKNKFPFYYFKGLVVKGKLK